MDDPIISGEEDACQTPPNAKRAARRKMRESLLSPSSMRAVKLSKVKDDIMFEKVQFMIKAKLNLMRSDMEMELVKSREVCKLQLYNELTIEMQNKVRAEIEVAQALWRKELDVTVTTFTVWKSEMEKRLNEKDALIEELKREFAEYKNKLGKDKDVQPIVIEELNSIKEQVKTLKEEEQLKTQVASSWAERLFKTQEKVEEAEKWIADAKQGKVPIADGTPTSTIINMTIEEEQKRKTRAMHIRITGVKDSGNVEEEVKGLLQRMGVPEPLHTSAWRVGKKGLDSKGNTRDRALILRFPTLEARKDFLKKRPALKETGIFLGDDLTLAQIAHM